MGTNFIETVVRPQRGRMFVARLFIINIRPRWGRTTPTILCLVKWTLGG